MKFRVVLIIVENIQRSRDFYENVLHQTVTDDFGENVTFGYFSIHERKHFQTLLGNKPVVKESNAFELYFEDDNLEQIEQTLTKLNIEFVHGIVEQPWKQRVMRFYDYDKNLIEIGESMEHVAYRLHTENYTISEIAKITYLDEPKVQAAIQKFINSKSVL